MGGDYFALCLALEELGKVDQSVAITLEAGVSLGAMPVYRFGTEEQKQEWLPLLASGKALGAFGLTEAGGGSGAVSGTGGVGGGFAAAERPAGDPRGGSLACTSSICPFSSSPEDTLELSH